MCAFRARLSSSFSAWRFGLRVGRPARRSRDPGGERNAPSGQESHRGCQADSLDFQEPGARQNGTAGHRLLRIRHGRFESPPVGACHRGQVTVVMVVVVVCRCGDACVYV